MFHECYISSSPLSISKESRGKVNVPCDCFSSEGPGTFNGSLAIVVIIPCNSVLERNKICIHDHKTMPYCKKIFL